MRRWWNRKLEKWYYLLLIAIFMYNWYQVSKWKGVPDRTLEETNRLLYGE
jgi:hypothetical protein